MSKLSLYFYTVKSMKASQVYYRLKKMAGLPCVLPCRIRKFDPGDIRTGSTIEELNYDPVFLSRFSADDLLEDRVSFLHQESVFHWDVAWQIPEMTQLWNFNLHYFEYLFALTDAYKRTGNQAYFAKSKNCILSWIQQNPQKKGTDAWAPYTVSLRLANWLDYYKEFEPELKEDTEFCRKFLESVYEQYEFLSRHLEKDLLGNHYLENLKALILCALFFKDDQYCDCVLNYFREECRQQILSDGIHYELSPMYHKIILEDLLKVAFALREAGMRDSEIEGYLGPMLDAAYSLEEGLNRVPLFNDCGNNVSKSLNALMAAAENHFDIAPKYRGDFPESGYYIFKKGHWKLIVDAGQPGPKNIPGHAHCDAMSFELFKDGQPMIVNCGTYAYQSDKRQFFRSTEAHNTVMIDGVEQSECWGKFRVAKRAKVRLIKREEDSIEIEMDDQAGHTATRSIYFDGKRLRISDECKEHKIQSFLHFPKGSFGCETSGHKCELKQDYAEDFGQLNTIQAFCCEDMDKVECTVDLE